MADKKTPVFDWDRMDFKKASNATVATTSGNGAAREIIFKAQQTRRSVYLIYADPESEENNHKYGSDLKNVVQSGLTGEALSSEVRRAVREAIVYLEGIQAVRSIEVAKQVNDETYISALITTDYGDELPIEGVVLNG